MVEASRFPMQTTLSSGSILSSLTRMDCSTMPTYRSSRGAKRFILTMVLRETIRAVNGQAVGISTFSFPGRIITSTTRQVRLSSSRRFPRITSSPSLTSTSAKEVDRSANRETSLRMTTAMGPLMKRGKRLATS